MSLPHLYLVVWVQATATRSRLGDGMLRALQKLPMSPGLSLNRSSSSFCLSQAPQSLDHTRRSGGGGELLSCHAEMSCTFTAALSSFHNSHLEDGARDPDYIKLRAARCCSGPRELLWIIPTLLVPIS